MPWLIDEHEKGFVGSDARILEPKHMKAAGSTLAWKILNKLAEKPSYPRELAESLSVHEQKVYYHIRNLEKSGMVEVSSTDLIGGAAAKTYSLTGGAFALVLKRGNVPNHFSSLKLKGSDFLDPFIKNGKLDAIFVLGSHEPHGPTKARAHDSHLCVELSLLLGSYLNFHPRKAVKLDTEMKEDDYKQNLIILGGPGVNQVAKKVNAKLPVRFVEEKQPGFYSAIYSTISKKTYEGDKVGLLVKAKNPFNPSKKIIVIAGRTKDGTSSATLAMIEKMDEVCKGRKDTCARVVEGWDELGEGCLNSVEFLE